MFCKEIFKDILKRIKVKLEILVNSGEILSMTFEEIKLIESKFESKVIVKKSNGTNKIIIKSGKCVISSMLLVLIETAFYLDGISEELKNHYTLVVTVFHDHDQFNRICL